MKEINGYIKIKNGRHFSIDNLQQYIIDSREKNKVEALNRLLIKSFELNINTQLSTKEVNNYLKEILKDEEWISKYFVKNKDIYEDFYNAVSDGINDISYLNSITGLAKCLSEVAKSLTNVVMSSYENILNNNTLDSLKTFAQTLASINYNYKEIELVDKNVDKLINYGWVVSFELEDYLFERIPGRKSTNKLVQQYYTKPKIRQIESEIMEYLKFDKNLVRYFKESKRDYLNKSYYSCAVLMFAIIDRLLSMSFDMKPGIRDVANLKKKLEQENFYNGYVNYSTVKILFNLYSETNNFTLCRDKLNRNMLIHGWMKRNIEQYECLQLLLVIKNLLFILNNETNIMSEVLKNM